MLQGSADLQGYGNSLANTLYGNTGSNLLDGGAGADAMFGGAGNDVYFVDNAGDGAIENANEGTDAVFATAHFALSANVETLVLQGSCRPAGLRQQPGEHALRQHRQQSPRRRRRRRRHVSAGPATTSTSSNAGDAVVENANEGTDAVFSTTHFALSANVETLVLQGSADLQGYGNSLANTLYGNTGSNLLDGGAGADVMFGGAGNDVYFVTMPATGCSRTPTRAPTRCFPRSAIALAANVETLVLQGAGNLAGTGNALANNIYGNSGDNTLDGGAGADMLTGNAGNDTFVFNVGQANGDTVVDFDGQRRGGGGFAAVRRLWRRARPSPTSTPRIGR